MLLNCYYFFQVPLEPNRTVSVFRERIEKHKDELAELEVLENVHEKVRPVSHPNKLIKYDSLKNQKVSHYCFDFT